MKLSEIKNNIPSKIVIPKEFDQFFEWTQNKENLINGNIISGSFEWCNDNKRLIHWFGKKNYKKYKIAERIGVFGVGSMGNMYCFWIDDEGNQKIVHLDYDAYELLVLANDFKEFLQYLAIGYPDPDTYSFNKTAEELDQEDLVDYKAITKQSMIDNLKKSLENFDEIAHVFDKKTVSDMKRYSENEIIKLEKMDNSTFKEIYFKADKELEISYINYKLRTWVKDTFQVKIPSKGNEILHLEDKSFENWINTMPYD